MTNVAQTIEVAAESSCERGDISHREFATREEYELAVTELRKVVGYQGDTDNHDAETLRCEAWGHAGGCDWRVHVSAPRSAADAAGATVKSDAASTSGISAELSQGIAAYKARIEPLLGRTVTITTPDGKSHTGVFYDNNVQPGITTPEGKRYRVSQVELERLLTGTVVTDEQIAALRDEAGAAGDLEQVAICERALEGDDVYRARCVRVIANAAAQS